MTTGNITNDALLELVGVGLALFPFPEVPAASRETLLGSGICRLHDLFQHTHIYIGQLIDI